METKSYFLHDSTNLPPEIFRSPLKRKRSECEHKSTELTSDVAKNALKQSLEVPPEKKLKVELKVKLPDVEQKLIEEQPFSIRSQVETLQYSLKQSNRPFHECSSIIILIEKILKNLDCTERDKLVELGILHYYFASHKEIPILINESLLEHRIWKIESEALKLVEQHGKNCTNDSESNLPSGATTYLMRAISRMIFPPDGAFNLGGCHAVIALLDSTLNAFLSEEMRAQILNITQRFINDESFRLLFQEPFEVHPEMAKLLFIELKIPPQERMSFIYVRWCIVTALFYPIGQFKEDNCYALAMFLNMLSNKPEIIIQLLIEALRKGTFCFDSLEISIPQLLEFQGRLESDFEVEMTASKAHNSVPYLTTSAALRMPLAPRLHTNRQHTLNFWMEQDFNENVELAKELYISHRVSFLQQMVLSIFQFYAQNSLNAEHSKSSKLEFLNQIIDDIKSEMGDLINMPLAEKDPLWGTFFSNFTASIKKSFFCIDCSEGNFDIKDNQVIFSKHSRGFIFNGNIGDYKPFKCARRLFHFASQNGSLTPVDQLSTFAHFCVDHLDHLAATSDSFATKQWRMILRKYLKSSEFLTQLAETLAWLNEDDSSMKWKEYFKSDSLFLIQTGGRPHHIKDLPLLKETFQCVTSISGLNPALHFVNLCQRIAHNRNQLGSYILAECTSHVFNIIPDAFQNYIYDPFNELQNRVIRAGDHLLSQELSFEKMERALKITLGAEKGEAFAEKHFDNLPLSCFDFVRTAESLLQENEYLKFKSALNRIMQSFSYKELKQKLPTILSHLNLFLDKEEFIFQMKERKGRFNFTPAEGASLVHEALIAMDPSIFISKLKLEEVIRIYFGFPQIIFVGNLNWINAKADQFDFHYLILKYDFAEKQVVYAERTGKKDDLLDNEILNDLCKKTQLYF